MVRILNGAERSRGIIKTRGIRTEQVALKKTGSRESKAVDLIRAVNGTTKGGIVGGNIVKNKPLNTRSSQLEKMRNATKGARHRPANISHPQHPTALEIKRIHASRVRRERVPTKSMLSGGGLSTGLRPLGKSQTLQNRVRESKQGAVMMKVNSLHSHVRL